MFAFVNLYENSENGVPPISNFIIKSSLPLPFPPIMLIIFALKALLKNGIVKPKDKQAVDFADDAIVSLAFC